MGIAASRMQQDDDFSWSGRKLRFFKRQENLKWCYKPDRLGSAKLATNLHHELLTNCKSFEKLRFPEIHAPKYTSIDDNLTQKKESVLQSLRQRLKEEKVEEKKLKKMFKKEAKYLTKLEKKYAKESTKPKTQHQELGWFFKLLKDCKGVLPLHLFTSLTDGNMADSTNNRLKDRLVIHQLKGKNLRFKVSEKCFDKESNKWQTTFLFKSTTVHVVYEGFDKIHLKGEQVIDGKNVTFNLVFYNKMVQQPRQKLMAVYVRKTKNNDKSINTITWVARRA